MPSIYKTPDGAVFKTPDGKLIKEPYNFGNAFQNRMGLNNYFEITELSIAANWSIIGICDTTDIPRYSGGSGFIQLSPSTLDIADNIMLQGGRSLVNLIDNVGLIQVDTNDNGLKIFYIQLTNNSGIDSGNSIYYAANNIDTRIRTTMRLGASGIYSSNTINITEYLHPKIKINKLFILDRIVSLSEYKYLRNNLLFNNLQSYNGVCHQYNFGTAEIISVLGTDTVCIRDQIGVAHARITKIPAGTAQQKVNYYNTNLSVPFQ